MSAGSLAGRVALVTGASKGFGAAISFALGEAGAAVAMVARGRQDLDQAVAEARRRGAEAEAFVADVGDEGQVQALEKAVIARFGKVEILVNNAGINVRKPLAEFSLEEWDRVFRTNLYGPFLVCRAFVPHMKGRGYGRILNLTSVMSHVALPGRTAYAATKAGLLGFTRALALELAPEGISVVGVSPGVFSTEMNRRMMADPELSREFLSGIPMGRWGRPEEVGRLAVYLCSEDAGYITGTDVLMDGGWCTR